MAVKIFIVIFVVLISIFQFSFEYQFDEMEIKSGVMFANMGKAKVSFKSYGLLYHYDLSTYIKLTASVTKCVEEVEKLCELSTEASCAVNIMQLKVLMGYMKKDEVAVEAYQLKPRTKRAIETIGSIYHWAFGLMDAHTAKEYDEKINELQNETVRVQKLITNQTMLFSKSIELSKNIYYEIEANMKKVSEKMIDYWDETSQQINKLKNMDRIMELIQLAKLIIMEHQRLSQQLLGYLESVNSGKIVQIVPLEKLIHDLVILESCLEETESLPINVGIDNPMHIFKFSKIRASLYGERIIIEVIVPAIERQMFVIYKVVPIPIIINNYTMIIKTTMDYVLLNDRGCEYIKIANEEYSRAIVNMANERIIIEPKDDSHFDFLNNCEINILMNIKERKIAQLCNLEIISTTNYFIPIIPHDSYFVSLVKPIVINERCKGNTTYAFDMKKSGVLTLQENCRIYTEKISLRSNIVSQIKVDEILFLVNKTVQTTTDMFLNKIKHLNNISLDVDHSDEIVLISDYKKDFDELSNNVKIVVNEANNTKKFKEIHYGEISSFFSDLEKMLYIVLVIVVLIIILCCYRCFRCCCCCEC